MAEMEAPVFPPWQYIYQKKTNPVLDGLCQAVCGNRQALAEIRNTPFRKSIEAERVLVEDLVRLGFLHSVTNRKFEPLFKRGLNFEIDFYHTELQVAVEVEKGEISNIWKNLCKFAESPVVRHGVLLVPVIRQGQQTRSEFYQNTIKRLCNMEQLFVLIDSLVVIGY